jgi:hypothetical protein
MMAVWSKAAGLVAKTSPVAMPRKNRNKSRGALRYRDNSLSWRDQNSGDGGRGFGRAPRTKLNARAQRYNGPTASPFARV